MMYIMFLPYMIVVAILDGVAPLCTNRYDVSYLELPLSN